MRIQAVFVVSVIGLGNALALPASTKRTFSPRDLPARDGRDTTLDCSNTVCISEQHGVFHPELGYCLCDWIEGLEPDPPVETQSLPARDEKDTTLNCSNTFCISEQHGVFHPELGYCLCDWIKGLEPGPPIETQILPTRDEKDTTLDCSNTFCISEQHGVFHPELGYCLCDWIEGLEPGPSTSVEEISAQPVTERSAAPQTLPARDGRDTTLDCSDTFCISEQHGVFHSELGYCLCDWIEGLEPGPPSENDEIVER
ncbi:hypothetical protein MMC29_001853 [Sticta canariensis]|nr:hypothetical protein [Sticta canariensis]